LFREKKIGAIGSQPPEQTPPEESSPRGHALYAGILSLVRDYLCLRQLLADVDHLGCISDSGAFVPFGAAVVSAFRGYEVLKVLASLLDQPFKKGWAVGRFAVRIRKHQTPGLGFDWIPERILRFASVFLPLAPQ
jgi:hypothetical protein